MKHEFFILALLLISCRSGNNEQEIPKTMVQEIETVKEIASETNDKVETHAQLSSALRPNEKVSFNQTYIDTLEFKDYNDDLDFWYLNGYKNDAEISLIYNWVWRGNEAYNFRPGDLIAVHWTMERISMAGDEEVIDIVERAVDAKKIMAGNQPIRFLKREMVFDPGLNTEISAIVINQSFLQNITPPEKAALGYITFDIGNECEWGYDPTGNRRVLWCQIASALDLGHQCSDTQLNFLRKWFAQDSVALKKLESCPTLPNTATIQTTFDEILVQRDELKKTIELTYNVTGMNLRESNTWQRSHTDVFEYGANQIALVDSKKRYLSEDDINMNPDAAENIDPQNFALALKEHILNQWKKQDNFNTLKITFTDNVLNIKGTEGFILSNYDFNEMVINGTNDPQTLYLTITNKGGGEGGNVILEETYVLTVLDAENFDIRREETKLIH